MQIEMSIKGLMVDPVTNTPIVILRDKDGQKVLPIWVGIFEANAIALQIENISTPRPMTHDLLRNILEEIGAEPKRIVVTELREHTFYAEIELVVGKTTHRVSSRPSDAIALAARTGTPIFAEEQVLAEAGQIETETAEGDPEELVDEFREFIEHVSPEDFG